MTKPTLKARFIKKLKWSVCARSPCEVEVKMSELPIYVQRLARELIAAVKYANPEELQKVREFLMDAAKATIDIEIYNRIRGSDDRPPNDLQRK